MRWLICSPTVYLVLLGSPDVGDCDGMHKESGRRCTGAVLADVWRSTGGTRVRPLGRRKSPNRPVFGARWSRALPELPRLPPTQREPCNPGELWQAPAGREGSPRAPISPRERCFIVGENPTPDDDPTVTHLWMRALRRLRDWAAEKAARFERAVDRHSPDVKSQMIRGVSYGVGSGAVSILFFWWENRH